LPTKAAKAHNTKKRRGLAKSLKPKARISAAKAHKNKYVQRRANNKLKKIAIKRFRNSNFATRKRINRWTNKLGFMLAPKVLNLPKSKRLRVIARPLLLNPLAGVIIRPSYLRRRKRHLRKKLTRYRFNNFFKYAKIRRRGRKAKLFLKKPSYETLWSFKTTKGFRLSTKLKPLKRHLRYFQIFRKSRRLAAPFYKHQLPVGLYTLPENKAMFAFKAQRSQSFFTNLGQFDQRLIDFLLPLAFTRVFFKSEFTFPWTSPLLLKDCKPFLTLTDARLWTRFSQNVPSLNASAKHFILATTQALPTALTLPTKSLKVFKAHDRTQSKLSARLKKKVKRVRRQSHRFHASVALASVAVRHLRIRYRKPVSTYMLTYEDYLEKDLIVLGYNVRGYSPSTVFYKKTRSPLTMLNFHSVLTYGGRKGLGENLLSQWALSPKTQIHQTSKLPQIYDWTLFYALKKLTRSRKAPKLKSFRRLIVKSQGKFQRRPVRRKLTRRYKKLLATKRNVGPAKPQLVSARAASKQDSSKLFTSLGYNLPSVNANDATDTFFEGLKSNIFFLTNLTYSPLTLKLLHLKTKHNEAFVKSNHLRALDNLHFGDRKSYYSHSNLASCATFSYRLQRRILKTFSFNRFNVNVTMWYYNNLVRFIENCTGRKTLLKFHTSIENELTYTDLALCSLWHGRVLGFQRILGPRFFLKESLKILHLAVKFKDPALMSNWIKAMMRRMSFWKYRLLFRYIKYVMRYLFWANFNRIGFKGLKLKLKGKISVAGNARTRTLLYRIGETSHSTFDNRVAHEFSTISTFTGVMGFQIWFFF